MFLLISYPIAVRYHLHRPISASDREENHNHWHIIQVLETTNQPCVAVGLFKNKRSAIQTTVGMPYARGRRIMQPELKKWIRKIGHSIKLKLLRVL